LTPRSANSTMRYDQRQACTRSCSVQADTPMSERIAIVLWGGGVGGAETLMGDVAISMRQRSVDVTVLCIGDPMPLADRLRSADTPCLSLGHEHGSAVALHPRRLADTVQKLGHSGAIVNAVGYLPRLIQLGGYGSPMLAVEHGDALNLHTAPYRRRLRVRAERWLCSNATYTDIAVSDTLLKASTRVTGRTNTRRIYNGVNLQRFRPTTRSSGQNDSPVTIGLASRLAPGKGVEILLGACASLGPDSSWSLNIAGDGPESAKLRAYAHRDPVLRERVTFVGTVSDMPKFWTTCDVAVVSSSQWLESFSMAAVEAMACGLPVIASASGALPEICGDQCGTLVPAGDVPALTAALRSYIADPARRRAHGVAGRQRAEEHFDIEHMVDQYLEALHEATP
jgi:glycosyltransferase involved in cell wall biosynthesis